MALPALAVVPDLPTSTGVYVRISKDKKLEALGVNLRQKPDILAHLQRLGWGVGGIYVDNDISAARKDNGELPERPEFNRLRADIKAGRIDAVAGWDLDRVFRDCFEMEEFFLLCQRVGMDHFATVAGDAVTVNDGEGILTLRVKAAVAAEEVRKLRKRVKRKHRELAERGLPSGGRRAFGYEADRMTVVPEEAALICEARDRIFDGDSLVGIIKDWNERGIRAASGGVWNRISLRSILISGRISGQREVGVANGDREIVGPAAWPAIISPNDTTRLRAILLDPSRRKSTTTARKHPLGGFLTCSKCGGRMGTGSMNGVPKYRCQVDQGGCGNTTIDTAKTDAFVVAMFVHACNSEEMTRQFSATNTIDLAALDQAIEEDEAELLDLSAMKARKELTMDEWKVQRSVINARLEANKAARDAELITDPTQAYIGRGDALAAEWDGWSLDKKRTFVAAMVETITVLPGEPGKRFDGTRLRPVWKG